MTDNVAKVQRALYKRMKTLLSPDVCRDAAEVAVAALGQPDTAEASSEQEWVEKATPVIEEALEVPVIQVVGARGNLVARRLWPLVRQGAVAALGQPDTAPAEDEALDNAAADVAYWTAKAESTAAELTEARGQAARLREAIENAPHEFTDCVKACHADGDCDCWKSAALAATDQGAQK